MKTQIFNSLFALLLLTSLPLFSLAQTVNKNAIVKVSGEVLTPLDITAATLKNFNQTSVTRKDRDDKDHTFSGVALVDILKKAGATMDKELTGENLTKYLLVEASDGYQVIFALAELDKNFTDRAIILTDNMDGKPLPAADGPFRIIIQDEKRPARCIKQVTSMQVRFSK